MPTQYTNLLESSALFLSGLCVLHCLGLPLLLVSLPALASVISLPEGFHFTVVLVTLPVSLAALATGRRQHKSIIPLAAGIFGLLFMTAALTERLHNHEIILTVIGASGLAFAHINNWNRRSQCQTNNAI